MTLDMEQPVAPSDAPQPEDRFGDAMPPMIPAEKRARIYAVLAFGLRARFSPSKTLDILGEACQRKNQEDKQLATAVPMIRSSLEKNENIGEVLLQHLGRMLSVEEFAILKLVQESFRNSPLEEKEREIAIDAMESLLRLRKLDLLEVRRPQ